MTPVGVRSGRWVGIGPGEAGKWRRCRRRVPDRPADGRRAPVRDRRSRPRRPRRGWSRRRGSDDSSRHDGRGGPDSRGGAAGGTHGPGSRCRRRSRRSGGLASGCGGSGRRPGRRGPRHRGAARDQSESVATRRRSRPRSARCARPAPDRGCRSCGGARPGCHRGQGPPRRCPRERRRRGSRPASPRDPRRS
jgi:hypothetical protein